jgi:hypothetical protein
MPIDADLIHRCADPSLKPALVETFVKAVGSTDPLGITVRSGNRIVLVPPAKTPEQALATVQHYVGHAVVRIGVTQYPAGIGIEDPSDISPDLFDVCSNLRQGTALFGKVWRIVLKWYGDPTDESVMPQVLDDAVEAWKTGTFEGAAVFTPADARPPKMSEIEVKNGETPPTVGEPSRIPSETPATPPNEAGIRVDLSGIGGKTP